MSSYIHSARQSYHIVSANCTFRDFLRLFFGDLSGMDKSSSATCLLYSDVVKGDPSPRWLRKYHEEDEEEAVKRAIKESEIFVSWLCYNFFLYSFFSITLRYHFFLYFFLPTTFTYTHDPHTHPRPTTFSYTPKLSHNVVNPIYWRYILEVSEMFQYSLFNK